MTEEHKPERKNDAHARQDLLWLSTLGINLVFSSAVGGVIGHYLDKLFKTSAVFTIVFFFIGTLAGILQIVRQIRKMGKDDNSKNEPKK